MANHPALSPGRVAVCPDNDVTREMDNKRIQWNADDMIKNRPALSRWHPDFESEFEAFSRGG